MQEFQSAPRWAMGVLVGILLFNAANLLGQGSTARLEGIVRDTSGAVVVGAKVTAKNMATNLIFTTQSDNQGTYALAALPVGTYELSAEMTGFKRYIQSGILLQVNENVRQDIVLEVGSATEAITVLGSPTQVDTTSASLRTVIDSRRVAELPLNGRNPAELVYLVAGAIPSDPGTVMQSSTYPGAVAVSSSGSRGNATNYLLDGGDNNDSYTNVNNPFPNPDALQEFSVQTNQFSAEYGRNAGAVVSAVSKSGTNSFHGSAYEYVRNSKLNAANFFSPDHASDGLKRNQYGATFGGPVLLPKLYNGHDHTFFFFSYQGTRVRQLPTTLSAVVPTAAQRNGDFSGSKPIVDPQTGSPFPGNQIPVSSFSPVTQKLLPMIPVPSDPEGSVLFSRPNLYDDDQYLAKIDHSLSTKEKLTGRYFISDYTQPANITTSNILAIAQGKAIRNQSAVLNNTYLFSPNLLNTAVFTYTRTSPKIISGAPFAWSDVGVNIFTRTPSELALTVAGGSNFSIASGHRSSFIRNTFHYADTTRYMHGRHEFSIGADIERQREDTDNDYHVNGSFRFDNNIIGNGTAAFLLGLPTRFGAQGAGEFTALRVTYYNFFVQDDIRVTRRLKLNLGLRYSPYFPEHDEKDRMSSFQPGKQSQRFPNAPLGLLYAGDPGVPRGGTSNDLNNLGPRVGFAYDVFGDGKTSVRGGYGVFYDQPNSIMIDNFVDIAPFSPQVRINVPYSFADPYHGRLNPFPVKLPPPQDVSFDLPVDVFSNFEPTFRMPYLQSWNLTVERQLKADILARVAYVGSKGTRLLFSSDINPAPYDKTLSLADNIDTYDDRRIYAPNFTEIQTISTNANSTYHSLQLTGEKRFSYGFSALGAFTWSKSIDACSAFADSGSCSPSNPYTFRLDKAVSDYDVPVRFVLSYVWDLPKMSSAAPVLARGILNGWQTAGILTFQNGVPLTVASGTEGALNGRPNVVGDPKLSSGRPRAGVIQEYFATAAFAFDDSANGTFGNAGRNILRGPGTKNLDASLMRTFSFTERYRLHFRADFFNLTNRVRLGPPDTDLSSDTFGRITTAGDPRIIQLSLRMTF